MDKIERVCPNCGTPNAYDRDRCSRCGTSLTTLPAARQSTPLARIDRTGTAALIVGASALVARTGFKRFKQLVLPRVSQALEPRPASKQVVEPSREDEPDYTIRGWRVWSSHRGDEHSSGSEQFEWKVKRKQER